MGFDIDEFVSECRNAAREDAGQLAVREVVERAVSDPAALEKSFGTTTGATIDRLFNDAELTVLHFVWPPGVDLFPHEHKMWSTVGIYGGIEDNTMYRRVGDGVEVAGHRRGSAGDVLMLGVDGIHSVQNPTRQWTAAVHVYGGDFFDMPRLQWDKLTGEPQPFDLANARSELATTEARARRQGWID
jgi:predicted metal-dependent enzyme (double-stranded beta helix superfamily)